MQSEATPRLESARLVYSQPEDSDGRSGVDIQALTVEVTDAGGGPYLVISTERWAVDDPAEFVDMLRHALAMVATQEGTEP